MKAPFQKESAPIPRLRLLGYGMAAVFAVVGGLFLILPRGVVSFFNSLSAILDMAPSPAGGLSFFSAMASAYMTVVTILAWNLGRRPWDRASSRLLVQAKSASSLVSLILFLFREPWLILLVNGIVDALIGALVFFAFRNVPSGEEPSGKSGPIPDPAIRFEDAGSSKNDQTRK
jgi:hypothetical protein